MSKILDTLDPIFKERIEDLLLTLKEHGVECVPTSGRRTIAEQDKLYAQGRTTKGDIVTKAKGGQSPHNFGLAVDLCPLHPKTKQLWWDAPDDIWNMMHRYGEEAGLRVGYDFKSIKDAPHFEDSNWKVVQAKWKEGKIRVA